jgi:transcription elongation factor Elf1
MNEYQLQLWAKARLYAERATNETPDSPLMGLWAALTLEILAKCALAHKNVALVAAHDPKHTHLLAILGLGTDLGRQPHTIPMKTAIDLCKQLYDEFTEDDRKLCEVLASHRNEELHGAGAPFEAYQTGEWLSGFYRACKALCGVQGKELADLLGDDVAGSAANMIRENSKKVSVRVKEKIKAHKEVFDCKTDAEKKSAKARAKKSAEELAHAGHHKVECPACGAQATVEGVLFGKSSVETAPAEIIVRRSVEPQRLRCEACGLRLDSFAELEAAQKSALYRREFRFSPDQYYELDATDRESPEWFYDYSND